MEQPSNGWNSLRTRILKAVKTASRVFALVTSRKTAGLATLRASRLKAAFASPAVKRLVHEPSKLTTNAVDLALFDRLLSNHWRPRICC